MFNEPYLITDKEEIRFVCFLLNFKLEIKKHIHYCFLKHFTHIDNSLYTHTHFIYANLYERLKNMISPEILFIKYSNESKAYKQYVMNRFGFIFKSFEKQILNIMLADSDYFIYFMFNKHRNRINNRINGMDHIDEKTLITYLNPIYWTFTKNNLTIDQFIKDMIENGILCDNFSNEYKIAVTELKCGLDMQMQNELDRNLC